MKRPNSMYQDANGALYILACISNPFFRWSIVIPCQSFPVYGFVSAFRVLLHSFVFKIKSSVFEKKTIQLPEQLNDIFHFDDTKLTRSFSVCLYESNSFGRFETKKKPSKYSRNPKLSFQNEAACPYALFIF